VSRFTLAIAATTFLLGAPSAGATQTDPFQDLSEARLSRDANALVDALDRIVAADPPLGACAAGHLMAEDPWPDAGFADNEALRQFLTPHLADQGITPMSACDLVWSDHVSLDLPEGLSDPMQMTEMDLADKRDVLMQIALYFPYERGLFDRLIHLAGTESQPEAQELALTAAARLLARAPAKVDPEAGALMTLLRGRAEQPSTREHAADIAGIVVAQVPSVNLIVLTQYLGDDPAERRWALDVWRRTDFRHLDDTRGIRVVEVLLDSNAGGEFGWAEAAALAHIDPLTALVKSRIWSMLGSSDETERVRGVQWAAATRITPDEFLPWMVELYAIDTPAVRAMCGWGIAELAGSTERYEQVVPLLPTVVEDMHHDDPRVAEGAADLLRQLLAVQCNQPERFAGLDGILSALTEELSGPDPQRRQRVLDLLARVRSDCLPPQIRDQLRR